jgi:pyruvate ferredoxin oxidoreductase beta subunit
MDRYSVFAPKLLPAAEDFVAGLRSCPGCGRAMAVRIIAKALAHSRRYPYGSPAVQVRDSELPYSGWRLFDGKSLAPAPEAAADRIAAAAGEASSLGQGIALCAEARKKKQPFLYICFFNESGIERHSASAGPGYYPDRTCGILQRFEKMQACLEKAKAAKPDYFATACPAYPFDCVEKVSAALRCGGTGFIGVLVPCPTGCLYDPALSLESGKRAVDTGLFPLYQLEQGVFTLTVAATAPASSYTELQPLVPAVSGRELEHIQRLADKNLRGLRGRKTTISSI